MNTPNDIKTVLEHVKTELGLSNLTFACSTVTEFIETLPRKADDKKYPFFWIDSTEIRYDEENRICYIGNMVIATHSKIEYIAEEREQLSMKAKLEPLLECFLKRVKVNRNVILHKSGDVIKHYFYGKTGISGYESGIFPDHVDAIQLKNFQFRYYKCN